jgi:LysM repeat protein
MKNVGYKGAKMARTYTVVAGDTLSAIALRFYGNANLFALIATANGIADPNVIAVGQVLTIPDAPGHALLQPFSHDIGLGWNGGEIDAQTKTPFTVPAGKRLVLEDISIAAVMGAAGQKLRVNLIVVGVNGEERRHGMPVVFQMTEEDPSASESDLYAGAGPSGSISSPVRSCRCGPGAITPL